ncbi:SMC-Scp complex subunit ScpB [Porticoccus hydrocarbonoclasticus]|jgi:segregation and condensation protein B|uniref:SMC-Scp complex subunit ScpB n=1 Tax=Porticoccus hydrocarbonoclasticus TaxID=1073414 RepID=UPI00068FAFB2|nr:SMC-Scp complex subunit ScpB [Porticoccus hydrocarbonoclasticus]
MENDQLKKIVEGALLAAGRSLDIGHLQQLFDIDQVPEKDQLLAVIDDIDAECSDRGFELKRTGSGYRIQVRQELSPWINRLWEEKPKKYSRALLETLALIAYRQPLTRGDIEEVRGVSVSSEIIKTLLEREWIRAVGHRDVPGRPALYATTREFLDYFSLSSLDQLPPLNDIRDIDDINPSLTLDMSARKQSDKEVGDASVAAAETEDAGVGSRPDDNDNTEINPPSRDWQH